jgi:hypothetical protein
MSLFDNQRGAALTFVLMAPLVPWLGARAGRALGYGQRQSLAGGCLLAFATMMFPYSRDSHDNFLIALGTLWAFVALAAPRRPLLAAASAGLAFGLTLNVKLWAVAMLPMVAWLLPVATAEARAFSLTGWVRGWLDRRTWLRCAVFGLAAAPAVYFYCDYVSLRFGSPFGDLAVEAGKGSPAPLLALAGLTIGPAKSVFLYNPILVLAPVALWRLCRRAPRLGAGIALGAAGSFAMTCMYANWHGDMCWGPRYVLPAVALLALTLPELAGGRREGLVRWAWRGLLAASVAVQLIGSSVYVNRYFDETGHTDLQYVEDRTYRYYFTLEPSQFSSAVLAVPEVVRVSLDMALHGGRAVAGERAALQGIPLGALEPAVREQVASRLRLLADPGYSTLSWWWVFDAVAKTSVAWSAPLSTAILALSLIGAALGALALAVGLSRASGQGTGDHPGAPVGPS